MTNRLRRSDEPTYGERRAIEHLSAAAETMRSAIMHDVPDRAARTAALALVNEALGAAVQGVGTV
jgi:hypothetical protein